MTQFGMNDFTVKVKAAFDFLASDGGYRLTHDHVSSSFDNGALIYESEYLRVQVVRDRGQVTFTVRAKGDYHDIDEEILALLLVNASRYTRPETVPDFEAASSARFLRTNLPAIERLFRPDEFEETVRRAEALKTQRADVLFGPLKGH